MKTEQTQDAVEYLHDGKLPVAKIRIESNVRKHFDPAALKELEATIRKDGVIQPIIVKADEKEGHYVVVSGERRLRATQNIGLDLIPARVAKGSPEALLNLQMSENLHRADLGAIEEARAFKAALDAGAQTIEGLAERFSKSVKYVTRSVRLLELPKAAVRAIEKGLLTPEHGAQLLRAPEDRREKLVEYALAPKWGGIDGKSGPLPSIYELTAEVERRLIKSLSSACFPRDKEFAGVGACSACPFNSANQDVLFDGATEGNCLDGSCFTKKQNQALRDFRDEAGAHRFKGLKFVGYAGGDWGTPRDIGGEAILTAEEAKSAAVLALKKESPEKFGFGIIKPGRNAPTTLRAILVCRDPEFVKSKLRKEEKRAEREAPVMSAEDREREGLVDGFTNRAMFAAAAKSLRSIKKEHLIDIVLALDGTEEAYAAVGIGEGDVRKQVAKLGEKDLLRLAWLCAVGRYQFEKPFARVGVDIKAVRKDARAAALAEYERVTKESATKAVTEKGAGSKSA